MKITEKALRKIIREEINSAKNNVSGTEGAAKLTEPQKKQLNDLAKNAPSDLSNFSRNLKTLASIIDDIDPKAAAIDASQLKQYWSQTMTIVANMTSEEKTSASDTAKVTKALG